MPFKSNNRKLKSHQSLRNSEVVSQHVPGPSPIANTRNHHLPDPFLSTMVDSGGLKLGTGSGTGAMNFLQIPVTRNRSFLSGGFKLGFCREAPQKWVMNIETTTIYLNPTKNVNFLWDMQRCFILFCWVDIATSNNSLPGLQVDWTVTPPNNPSICQASSPPMLGILKGTLRCWGRCGENPHETSKICT